MPEINAFASAATDDLFPDRAFDTPQEDIEAAVERLIEQYPDAARELYNTLAETLMLASDPRRYNEAQQTLLSIGNNAALLPLRRALPKLTESLQRGDTGNFLQRLGIESVCNGLSVLLPS